MRYSIRYWNKNDVEDVLCETEYPIHEQHIAVSEVRNHLPHPRRYTAHVYAVEDRVATWVGCVEIVRGKITSWEF